MFPSVCPPPNSGSAPALRASSLSLHLTSSLPWKEASYGPQDTEACCHRDQWPVGSGKLAAGPHTCSDPGRCPAAALRRVQTQARSALDLSAGSAPVDRERRRSERLGNAALVRRSGDGRLSASHRLQLPDQSGAGLPARYRLAASCASRGKIKVAAASRMR